ncbi:MAG: L,D-transpeptidase family protein [Micromonosporaceae bacterium]|nr:L,D-transpeptidase family protein [Micromonosporaceae bacterium]
MTTARRGRALLAVLALLAIAASGCGTTPRYLAAIAPEGEPAQPAPTEPAELVFLQADNMVISPRKVVVVGITHGQLDDVSLVDSAGNAVPGTYDAAGRIWHSTTTLTYDTTYRLVARGTGADGTTVEGSRTFATLKPGGYTSAEIRAFRGYGPALDGGTFGVGQPIVIEFSRNVVNKAAVEAALEVKAEPKTKGAWRWIRDDEIHWRPREYWRPGTKVTVNANLYGVDFGDGRFGQANQTATFTIGPSKIAIADHDTKRMHIYIDGVDVSASIADSWDPSLPGPAYDHSDGLRISMGAQGEYSSRGWFDMRTSSGVFVVMEKSPLVRMRPDLPKTDPLYYEEDVPYAVRFTSSGLYVHWADWSVYDQGVRNVSHGCINLSPNDAVWFFNNFSYGDIVEVRNTGKPGELTDGVGDWLLTWEQWIGAA